MKLNRALILLFFISAGSLFPSCSKKLISVDDTSIALGTFVQINIVTQKSNISAAESIIKTAYDKIGDLENKFDYRKNDGALLRFNNSHQYFKHEDELLFSVLLESLAFAKLTDGYFDPTILPIVQLWGFDQGNPRVPSDAELQKKLRPEHY